MAGVGGGLSIAEAGTDLVQITVGLSVPGIGGTVLWGIGWLFNRLFPEAGHPTRIATQN